MNSAASKPHPPFVVSVVQVTALRLSDRLPRGVAAFAIDAPRDGDESVGAGFEINGWVLGGDAPVQGVRTTCNGSRSRLYPLDVPRPDVARDYPGSAHAARSGFTAWASVDIDAVERHVTVEVVLASGGSATLAEIQCTAGTMRRCGWPIDALPVTAPDFVIIGAQRGGTTSLHAYLSAHPQVRTPSTKELHYLTDRHERGLDWYLDQFAVTLPHGSLAGEATPYALFHPHAPERLQVIAPEIKLIVLLRNPVDRAYSHFLLERSRGFEPFDFSEAIAAEGDRLAGEESRLIQDPSYVSEAHKHASYLARGDYSPQLERWLASFPREQFLILRSEDMYEQPAESVERVAAFLGISPDFTIPFGVHNRSTGPPLDPAVRQRLNEHFAAKNERLARVLGWDPHWD